MKKRLISVVLCCLTLISLCSCGKEQKNVKPYDKEHETKFAKSFIAAQNDNWQLEWDSEHYRILLRDKSNSKIWSTLPSELIEPRYDSEGYEVINSPQLENPLTVEYIDPDTTQIEVLYAYTGSLKKGDYYLEKLDDGIKITYYFGQKEVSVPVVYRLLEEGINVSVDPAEITEGNISVYRISLSPFFCSASNSDSSSYLFVPSGSGALIYPKDWQSDVSYTCSYPVYGQDLQLVSSDSDGINNTEPVRLPVFGAKSGDSAICGIIDSGEESASIDCNVGNTRYGYSSVYASFYIRGISSKKAYSENYISEPVSVSFYPLYGDNASYIGMANKYRSYLEEQGFEKTGDDTALSLKIIGGTFVDEQFVGIPYKSLYAATTVPDAKEIIDDIYKNTGVSPVVSLVGFGESGIDVGRIAGNYKIASKLKGKELSKLEEFCGSIDASLFMDYDIVYFSKSSAELKKMFDSATNTVGQRALTYKTEFATGNVISFKEYLVKRSEIKEIAEKAIDCSLEQGIGVSFATAAQAAYSDYSSSNYYCKGNFTEDYKKIAEYCNKNDVSLLADNANAYSAVNADVITSAPTQSDKNDLFGDDIPFYQMVFKGYVPMTADAMNLSTEASLQLLKAVESGCGLGYTLIKNYNESLLTSDHTFFHACVYDDISDDLNVYVKSYKEYFDAIDGASIKEHYLLENGLRKTVFENGVTVYVNYGKNEINTEIGTVGAESYIYSQGGIQ